MQLSNVITLKALIQVRYSLISQIATIPPRNGQKLNQLPSRTLNINANPVNKLRSTCGSGIKVWSTLSTVVEKEMARMGMFVRWARKETIAVVERRPL